MTGSRKRRPATPTPLRAESTADGWVRFRLDRGFVDVALAKINVQWEIVGLRIDHTTSITEQTPEDAADLRDLLIRRMQRAGSDPAALIIDHQRLADLPLEELRAAAAEWLSGTPDEWVAAFVQGQRQQGKALPDERFAEVAAVYDRAFRARQAPVDAVARHWFLSRAGASKYIAKARKLKYLTAAPGPGKAGGEITPLALEVLERAQKKGSNGG